MAEQTLTEDELEQLYQTQSAQVDVGMPPAVPRESVYKFFRFILGLKDSSKVGNLKEPELGLPLIPVRSYQYLAQDMEKAWQMDRVKDYLMHQGEVTLATSLSRKGFLSELFVTQIKREKKDRPKEVKKGWFNFSKKTEGEG